MFHSRVRSETSRVFPKYTYKCELSQTVKKHTAALYLSKTHAIPVSLYRDSRIDYQICTTSQHQQLGRGSPGHDHLAWSEKPLFCVGETWHSFLNRTTLPPQYLSVSYTPSSPSVALTVSTLVPGAECSTTVASYPGWEKVGSSSLALITWTVTPAEVLSCGTPESKAMRVKLMVWIFS